MGVTEPAKVTISNRSGSSTKTFKNLTFKGGRPEKRLFGVPVIQFKNFKNPNRREFNSGSFLFYAKKAIPCFVNHEIVRNFQTNV
jgi:hypothetical protein